MYDNPRCTGCDELKSDRSRIFYSQIRPELQPDLITEVNMNISEMHNNWLLPQDPVLV